MENTDMSRATIGNLMRMIEEGTETVFDLKKGKDDKPDRLIVERRKLLPEAPRPGVRAETQARGHTFFAVNGFIDYLKEYGSDDTVIYANPGNGRINAVMAEKAEKGVEVVTLEPQLHPRWKPWAYMVDAEAISLDEFVVFIRNNRRSISKPDGRELVLTLSQVKMSTKVELQNGRGAKAINGIVVETNIQGTKNKDIVDLPEDLTVSTPIYVDTDSREIEIDLVLDGNASGTEIEVSLSAADVKEAMITAFSDICNTIINADAAFDGTFTYGSPEYREWNYLKSRS